MDHTALVEAMSSPDFYDYPVASVKYIQTHVSSLFLTGEYVYKLKKPVDFGFLDFTTAELRRCCCEKELELNRRLAPAVYLRVASIKVENGVPALDGSGEVVDWVVVMRQLDESLLGPAVLAAGDLTADKIDAVVDTLVPFYQRAATGPGVDEFGRIDVVKFNTDENFEQTAANVGTAITEPQYDQIRAYTNRFYRENQDLFERRISGGWIRECHGDLHLGNIFFESPPVIFDCIEFNERFRCSDVAVDLAFLVMDLDFQGRPELARRVIDRYVAGSGDEELPKLIGFYACYRAYVRGKIACFTAADPAVGEQARRDQIELAQRYFALAHQYAGARAGDS
jgi:aminoglycoside phosphotransferase family enzyme